MNYDCCSAFFSFLFPFLLIQPDFHIEQTEPILNDILSNLNAATTEKQFFILIIFFSATFDVDTHFLFLQPHSLAFRDTEHFHFP